MAPSGFTSRLQREYSATRNQQNGNRSGADRGSHPRGVYGLTRLSGTAATSTHGTKGVSTVSRNVPKPVQTSSLKKENGGQDISAVLVNRHGGPGKKVGWGSALSTPAPDPSAPASSLGPTPADSVNPPSSAAGAAPTKAYESTVNSSSENQPPSEHRPPLPPPPTESNRNVPWAMHPPSNPPPTSGLPVAPPNRGAPAASMADAHTSGNQSLSGSEYRQEKGEGSLQKNEYTRNQSERYERGYGGGEQYDHDSGVGAGQRLPPPRSHFSREYGNERYADADSMRGPGSSSHYQRRFPPLDEQSGIGGGSEGNYPSYYRDSRDREYYGGSRNHSDYRGVSRDYHDFRRGYHDRDRYDGGGSYRSRDRYYGNGEDRRWRDDRYNHRRSYGSDYAGGYDRDRRDYRDAHNNRYNDSYTTDSRRNVGGDSSRFRGYADETNDRRDGYLSDPQRAPNNRFWQDSHHSDERSQIPPAPCKQNMHQPPPQNEEDIIREAIRDREAAEARARIRAERKANGEEENSQGASENSHTGVASGDDVVRPVVLLRTNQTSGEASGDSSASPQRQIIHSAGEDGDPPAKSEVCQVHLDEADVSITSGGQNNDEVGELQLKRISTDEAEPVKLVDTVSSSSRGQGDDGSCEGDDVPLSECSQSELIGSESDQSGSILSESSAAESIRSERSDSNQPVAYEEIFHGSEEDRKREVAMEQQQKILRQVAATRASRNEVRKEVIATPAAPNQDEEGRDSVNKMVPPKEDEPTPEMIAKAARAEYRRNRKPRTRGVLFRREPDGTLVNVDTEVQLRKTLDRKPRKKKANLAKEKDNSSDITDAPVTPEKGVAPTPQANEKESDVKELQGEERNKPFIPAPSPSVSAWQAGPPPGMRLSTSPLLSRLSSEKKNTGSLMTEEAYPTLSTTTPEETKESAADTLETSPTNEQIEVPCSEDAIESTNETSGAILTLSSDDEHSADSSCRSPSDQGAEEKTTEKKKFNPRRPSRRVPRKRPKSTFSRHSHHSSRRPHRHRPTTNDSKRVAPAPVSSSDNDPAAPVTSHKSSRRKMTPSRINTRHRKPRESGNPSSKRATERYREGKDREADDVRRPKSTRPRPKRTTRQREPVRATEEKK